MFALLLRIVRTFWDLFTMYPSVQIEQIGTREEKETPKDPISYDYIIVGGGTAGCVLANRLSANPLVNVLLIERGTVTDTLFSNSILLSCPAFKWFPTKDITTAPQKALAGRELVTYEGIGLGGRTGINGAIQLQGCPEEYEDWGEGWSWDDVAPYFYRLERRLELQDNRNFHMEGGEWTTRVSTPEFKSTRQFANALVRMGVPTLEAYTNPETPTCFGVYPRQTLDAAGRRCSTYHAFLPKELVCQRKNLTICLGAHVQRVLFENGTNGLTARGVLVEGANNKLFTVRAKHEVILCAGAIVTPQLLLLSGVGPKEYLTDIGKPCIHDLSGVGSSLRDHFLVPLYHYIPRKDSVDRISSNPFLGVISFIQYLLFGTGLFTTLVTEYFSFFHTRKLPPNHDKKSCALPDIELSWVAGYGNIDPPKHPITKGTGTIIIQASVPKSFGTVRLAPNGLEDIKVDPIVDPKYLSAIEDREMYRRGMLFAREVAREMAKGYAIEELQYPDSFTPDDLDAYMGKFGMSGQHVLASCPMKPLSEGGVVDQELKVYGINKLRIADGSVLPRMVASRPQATVAMIGDRCADFIRQGWKRDRLFSPV